MERAEVVQFVKLPGPARCFCPFSTRFSLREEAITLAAVRQTDLQTIANSLTHRLLLGRLLCLRKVLETCFVTCYRNQTRLFTRYIYTTSSTQCWITLTLDILNLLHLERWFIRGTNDRSDLTSLHPPNWALGTILLQHFEPSVCWICIINSFAINKVQFPQLICETFELRREEIISDLSFSWFLVSLRDISVGFSRAST